jgi:aryl-alcohol dehydrogenase-like predicted oxidoreductase
MRKITLGRTNQTVSAISLGTWSFGGASMSGKIPVGWANQSETDSKNALRRSWEVGINHWDTADVYGDGKSESIIGEMWTKIPRNDIFLATKLGWDKGPYPEWYNPKHMIKNFERSLKNLKSDFVDLIYLHHCNFGKNDEYFDDALNTILKFKQQGKAKFIGLSDWSSKRIMKYIKKSNPDVVQPYRNVQDDDYQSSGLKDHINENNLGVCFFSPIKHGLLTGKYDTPPTFESGDHRNNIKGFKVKKVLDKIKENKRLLEDHFHEFENPVLHGIINALFNDSPTGCVLLGQRNIFQVNIASNLGEKLSEKDSSWVKSIYS